MSIAIVQAGSILYDTPATIDKLERLAVEAAEKGAKLVLFPEAFVGGYPKGSDFLLGIVLGTRSPEGREEFSRYFKSAIEENGPESKRIAEIAITNDIFIVVGVVERQGGTLYCSMFYYGPHGYMGKHRKLMPTALERWKIGGAICWENYMPMYRVTLYNKGIELYLACTVDDRETWLSTMRTIALEGRCFVISSAQFMTSSAYPEGHPMRVKHGNDKVLIRGGSCAVDPLGTILVEPDFTKELIQ
ncbi:Nitrilase/cyanide hydratase and apolipoprotein N-acyltransferase [Trichostrongylus colubriformis]|uniref:Nitrilase/cyanide hydratase and apolipoprotein N-acyltransferase n=1 Tax=Trichostrongylus colubriformis TaxID=6319 RepID=A0AAN8FRP7_TRICO